MNVYKVYWSSIFNCSGCMSGKEISSNYLNRLRQLEEIKKTIIFICGEIKYNNSNLDYVFTKISQKFQRIYKGIFGKCS